jgi:hypothetical protein
MSDVRKNWIAVALVLLCCTTVWGASVAAEKSVEFGLRTGQGGFVDSRSDIGKLGGGQMALDVRLTRWPVALSFSGEYYTNSPEPTNYYEIADMMVLNLLYMPQLQRCKRLRPFIGGGGGVLKVPQNNDPEDLVSGPVFNIEAGLDYRLFWKIGFYGLYKYLYAQKDVNDQRYIDFSEHIWLIGFSLRFSI